ncbi:MAG: tryptophan 7-halogenase [Lysobacter sp.]|nr:tryptophan 7-halogenase [Lysobacter sp.]
MSTRRRDVVIAGGGPAGAAAAIALARTGRDVLLVAGSDAAGFKVGEGLPPNARSLLRDLGVLERTLTDGHRASPGTCAVWGDITPHANDFLFQLHGHGLQLDRTRFDAMLRDAAMQAGAEILPDARVRIMAPGDSTRPHRLALQPVDGQTYAGIESIDADWLIDATGRAASLARALGARRIAHDAQIAFHQRLRSARDDDQDGRTWVEAVENGWWYSVLLPSRERLVAFLTDADLCDHRRLLYGDGLWRALVDAPALHALCTAHGYAPASRASGADASGCHLDLASGERWFAVGDAALAFDPLSSKGIANAIYTGLRAADALFHHESGDAAALDGYARHLLDIHRVYREQLRAFHAMETRWPEAPYWSRRQTDAGTKALSLRASTPATRAATAPSAP